MVPTLHDPPLRPPQAAQRLDEVLSVSAASHPDRVAIVDGSSRQTYAELDWTAPWLGGPGPLSSRCVVPA